MSTFELPFPYASRDRVAWQLDSRRVLRAAGWVVIAAIVATWVLLLRPQFLAGPAAYVVVSGISMEPSLHNGDLVVVHRRDRYRIGDTVLYRVPKGETGAGSLIIHRIIGGSAATGWIVQGDNKQVPDLWRPKSGDVVGSLWASVPGFGSVLGQAMSPLALASISTVLALLLGLPAAAVGAVESQSRRRPRPSDELAAPLVPLPTPAHAVSVASVSSSWGEAAWTARDLLVPNGG
ncbi:MAG TPA: signal peptidase I [Gaiellaceae bacterium]|nr:signal peptidase I [Gaiellaceae bacterium]